MTWPRESAATRCSCNYRRSRKGLDRAERPDLRAGPRLQAGQTMLGAPVDPTVHSGQRLGELAPFLLHRIRAEPDIFETPRRFRCRMCARVLGHATVVRTGHRPAVRVHSRVARRRTSLGSGFFRVGLQSPVLCRLGTGSRLRWIGEHSSHSFQERADRRLGHVGHDCPIESRAGST